MVRNLEHEHRAPLHTNQEGDISLEAPNGLTYNKTPPHGVAPETYGLLIFARDHTEILDIVDSLDKGKNRIINPTRSLLYVYYFNDISIRGLRKYLGGDRTTNGKRMLEALEVIWQQAPPEIQSQYPKEKAVGLKEFPLAFPQTLKKISGAAITLWQNESCRESALESLRNRKNNPDFIGKMQEIGRGRPSPMEGKKHSEQTTAKIRRSTQENWNKKHGIEPTDDPLAKKTALLNEWMRLSLVLGHSPSSWKISMLRAKDKTKFSITMYKQEFGQGSFTIAKEMMTLVVPSFEVAQKLTDYLNNKTNELSKSGISEGDIEKHSTQIKEACDKTLSATSEEEIRKGVERLDLLLSRIQRKISIMTPLPINKSRLRSLRGTP